MMFAMYQRLGVSVWAPPSAVIRAANKRLTEEARKGPLHRIERHAFYREMLYWHNQALCLCIQFGL